KLDEKSCVGGFPLAALRETNILMSLKHPNIIRAREMVVGARDGGYPQFNVFMVMDFWSHDLKSILHGNLDRPLFQSEVKLIMRQLLEAVSHMHENWIMHRDLKTENILY